MKLITAYLAPYTKDAVIDALAKLGITEGVFIDDGQAIKDYRALENAVGNLLPRVKLETVVSDALEEAVINAISAAAPGHPERASGKIFVTEVVAAINTYTKKSGDDALTTKKS